jgi:hypothetical protein
MCTFDIQAHDKACKREKDPLHDTAPRRMLLQWARPFVFVLLWVEQLPILIRLLQTVLNASQTKVRCFPTIWGARLRMQLGAKQR